MKAKWVKPTTVYQRSLIARRHRRVIADPKKYSKELELQERLIKEFKEKQCQQLKE